MKDEPDVLRERGQPTVLTPHTGEFAFLAGRAAADDRVTDVRERSRRVGRRRAPQGTARDHRVAATATCGSTRPAIPGAATGGTGDVLTGIVGLAARAGHDARGGDVGRRVRARARRRHRARRASASASLAAGDLPDALPRALRVVDRARARDRTHPDGHRTVTHAPTNYRPTVAEIDLGAIRHNVARARLLHVAAASRRSPSSRRTPTDTATSRSRGRRSTPARRGSVSRSSRKAFACAKPASTHRSSCSSSRRPRRRRRSSRSDLTPSVSTIAAAAEALNDAAALAGSHARVHACVDTGMHREGAPLDGGVEFVEDVARLAGLEVEGLWSHFAMGELDEHPRHGAADRASSPTSAIAVANARHRRPRRATSRARRASSCTRTRTSTSSGWGSCSTACIPPRRSRERCDAPSGAAPALGGRTRPPRAGRRRRLVRPHLRARARHDDRHDPDRLRRRVPAAAEQLGQRADRRQAPPDRRTRDDGHDHGRLSATTTLRAATRSCSSASQGAEEITATEIAEQTQTINYEVVCSVGPRVPRRYVS